METNQSRRDGRGRMFWSFADAVASWSAPVLWRFSIACHANEKRQRVAAVQDLAEFFTTPDSTAGSSAPAGLEIFGNAKPTVETVGYFLSLLRSLPPDF